MTQISDYVLRIPRYEHAWVEHEIAILKYFEHTKIPAPIVKTWSLSKKSSLKSRYTIQASLPGESVVEVYLDLNTQQRISFARELGFALKEMGKLRSSCAGTLDPYNIPLDDSMPDFLRLQCPPRNALRPGSSEPLTRPNPQTVYEFLMFHYSRQRAYDLTLHRDHLNPWNSFTAIIDHLHTKGFLKEITYALTHKDLEPRNILTNVTSPTTASLSGILDWDEAVFAPSFTNCKPPSWLWDFEGDDDEQLDECVASVMPQDPDLAVIKEAFEEAAGEEYLKYAYTPEYRIARNICRLAITGFHSNDEYEQAEKVIKEWNEMYPELKVGSVAGDGM
jgi:aminoglycoside phosphotransferase (APT) family kinase protein